MVCVDKRDSEKIMYEMPNLKKGRYISSERDKEVKVMPVEVGFDTSGLPR